MTTTLPAFSIIGIAVRTGNLNGQSGNDLAALWGKFVGEKLFEKIPNQVDNNTLYCLYTDYESDFMGEYTTILGCPVASLNSVPEGFVGRKFEATQTEVFPVSGALPDCVVKCWEEIWQSKKRRAYTVDVEEYKLSDLVKPSVEAKIYLSV